MTLSGTGASPAVATLAPPNTDFGSLSVGTTSSAMQVTLKNTGGGSLQITSITSIKITPNPGDFALAAGSTCSVKGTVAAGSSCFVNITFTPTAVGTRTATLSIADSAAGSPQTVSLSGAGEDFSFGTAPPAQTIAAGQTATFKLDVSALGGFKQAVALSCEWPTNQPPPGANCAVSPTSVTPSASGSPVTVNGDDCRAVTATPRQDTSSIDFGTD